MSSRRHTPAVSRFPFFVTITDTDDCIEWTGARMKTGYGFMNESGKPKVATHVALEYDNRPRPSPDMFALHSCDNPACVNPRHLRWGSQSENMQDQLSRGRNPRVGVSRPKKPRVKKTGPGKGWAKGIPKSGAGERRVSTPQMSNEER